MEFKAHMKPHIDDIDALVDALHIRKQRAFRITSSRNIPYLNEISNFCSSSPVQKIANTYFCDPSEYSPTDTLAFQSGGIYIQNPSSVLPAQILASFMPKISSILDMSAAPGGKTCALSDILSRQGIIIANEPSKTRLKSLHFNLEKCGAWNVKTISYDGRLLAKYYNEAFDGVLLDAPCSHENQLYLNKKVHSQWNVDYVHKMADLQKQLILSAFDCLKAGGVMVYSTCTFSIEENELIIDHLLAQRENAEIIPLDHSYSSGISGKSAIDTAVLRVFPHNSAFDGFFVAAVRKKGTNNCTIPAIRTQKIDKLHEAFINSTFKNNPLDGKHYKFSLVDSNLYLESALPIVGNFNRTGMVFARQFNTQIEISSQALWEFGASIAKEQREGIEYKIALDYMKGFDTICTNKYSVFLYYESIPVGVAKIVGDTYKNKLDRYFLYGKNIEF